MSLNEPWTCAACRAENLAQSEACRECGAPPAPRRGGAPGFAAILSGLLPGLGQLYQERWVRGILMALIPAIALLAGGGLALFADDVPRFLIGHAQLAALLLVGGLFAYHFTVVLDAFAGRGETAGRADERGPLGYMALLLVVAALVGVYGTAYRQTTAWAGVVTEVFEPGTRASPPPPSPDQPPAPVWNGTDRLNVLLLGLDRRSEVSETLNTDTMIVLSLDPLNRTAAMLSIPRDTLVLIPGHGRDKANLAYFYGGEERGPDLARRSVEGLLGTPIHSHALIDFEAFTKIVDSFGGVLVDVRRPLRDEEYPTANFGIERLQIATGPQLLDGSTALKFARSRHDSNDFARATRQQDVLSALRARLAQGGLLRVPGIVDRVGPAIQTNFDPANILPLARAGVSLDSASIRSEVLLPCGVPSAHCELAEENSPLGYYLIPDKAKIAELVAGLFYDPKVRLEAARVEVRFAGSRAALAQSVADRLGARAYAVAGVSDGATGRSAVIVRNAAKRYTADQLASQLGIALEVTDGGEVSQADIVVRLGTDFRGF